MFACVYAVMRCTTWLVKPKVLQVRQAIGAAQVCIPLNIENACVEIAHVHVHDGH